MLEVIDWRWVFLLLTLRDCCWHGSPIGLSRGRNRLPSQSNRLDPIAAPFTIAACLMAAITLKVGPLCGETAAPHHLATATGVFTAVGEIFGGGVAPIIAGSVAQTFGIVAVLWLPVGALILGVPLCLAITKPLAQDVASTAAGRYPVL